MTQVGSNPFKASAPQQNSPFKAQQPKPQGDNEFSSLTNNDKAAMANVLWGGPGVLA